MAYWAIDASPSGWEEVYSYLAAFSISEYAMKLNSLPLLLAALLPVSLSAQTFDWNKSLGGADNDYGTASTTDASGNIFVTGYFVDAIDMDPGPGTATLPDANDPYMTDAFVGKYDGSGNHVWSFSIGAAGSDGAYGITTDASGNIYVCGEFTGTVDFDPGAAVNNLSSGFTGGQIFVAKYTNAGDYVWAKTVASITHGDNGGQDVAVDASGNVYLAGYFQGTIDLDPGAPVVSATSSASGGNSDMVIVKLNSSGDYQWGFNVGGPAIVRSIDVDGSGNIVTTGELFNIGGTGGGDFDPGAGTSMLTPSGFTDIYIASYTTAGAHRWSYRFGSSDPGTSDTESGIEVAFDSNDDVILTGLFRNSFDADPSGTTANLTSAGEADIFLAKYSAAGAHVWSFGLGSSNSQRPQALALDAADNIYLAAPLFGYFDLDPTAGVFNYTNLDPSTALLTYDGSGAFLSYYNTLTTAGIYKGVEDLHIDNTGRLVLTGYYSGTTNCDSAGTPSYDLNSVGGTLDAVFASLSTGITGVNAAAPAWASDLYPNPAADGRVTLSSTLPIERLSVLNLQGQVVRNINPAHRQEIQLDLSDLPSGLYLVQVTCDGSTQVRRLVIE